MSTDQESDALLEAFKRKQKLEKEFADFNTWWDKDGSEITPSPREDLSEFVRRVSQIAWSNGAYKSHNP